MMPTRRRRSYAAALASVVFVVAAVMTLNILVLHGETAYHATQYDSGFLSTFTTSRPVNNRPSSITNDTRSIHPGIEEERTNFSWTDCFPLNSASWLKGPRLGNALLESDEAAMDLLLSKPFSFLLEQTICHKESRFLDLENEESDEASLNLAALRLIYLAFHIHQHEPARKEALLRHGHHCAVQQNVGNFDYECPDAKFLVVPLGEAGLGAVMRLTAVNALLAGMATNRVVMFVNNAPVGPQNVQNPWPHASCDRHDMQCFYLPPTPCVLTVKELAEAHVLQRSEMREMFKRGEIPGGHEEDRVVVTKINTRPHMAPEHLRENLVALAKKHIVGNALLERAVELIYKIEPLEESRYYYFGHSSKVHHAAVFYAMRPRPLYAKLLDKVVDSVPDDFRPDVSLGLPIRASDKCMKESECLDFEQHMKVMTVIWRKNLGAIKDTANIILTTESQSVMDDMRKFEADLKQTVPFSYRFITNEQDVMQGTGLPNSFESGNVTADDVMLSSVAALKLQLMARYTVGNCCSNFHNLLFDFFRDGCGSSQATAATMCLQEMEEPEFRVCCSWDKSEECLAKRQEAD